MFFMLRRVTWLRGVAWTKAHEAEVNSGGSKGGMKVGGLKDP